MKDTAPTDKAPKNAAPRDTAPFERFAYADILDMPRHVSAVHPRMSISDRAAQFSPFAALTGYGDAVEETARRRRPAHAAARRHGHGLPFRPGQAKARRRDHRAYGRRGRRRRERADAPPSRRPRRLRRHPLDHAGRCRRRRRMNGQSGGFTLYADFMGYFPTHLHHLLAIFRRLWYIFVGFVPQEG